MPHARDIDAARTRCRIRPDSSAMFATEFMLEPSDSDHIIFMYLVLPFEFTGSPWIFGRIMKAVGWFHHQRSPTNPLQNGNAPFKNKIFADDGMFSEPKIGDRPTQSAECWEMGALLFLGVTAISTKKLAVEGNGKRT